MANPDFPFQPANKFTALARAQFEATLAAGAGGKDIAHAVSQTGGKTKGAIEDVAKAIAKLDDRNQGEIVTLRNEIRAVRTFLENRVPEKDNVTALFAAVADTSGDIVARTVEGECLNRAGFKTIDDIAKYQPKKGAGPAKDVFVEQVRQAAKDTDCLITVMSQGELGRFFDLAPAVSRSMKDRPAQPPLPIVTSQA